MRHKLNYHAGANVDHYAGASSAALSGVLSSSMAFGEDFTVSWGEKIKQPNNNNKKLKKTVRGLERLPSTVNYFDKMFMQ